MLTTRISSLLTRGQRRMLFKMSERVQKNIEWREAEAARKRQQIAARARALRTLKGAS